MKSKEYKLNEANTDIQFMKRALQLARLGMTSVSPNPMVGAVVVKDNIILGEGYHIRSGQGHAEVNAIRNCGDKDISGATIYVTLEPCCHTNKKTPPCTSLLIDKKILRVVVASLDPNPDVSGKGLELLKNSGIEVVRGILKAECDKLNEVFFKYIQSKIPFIHLKLAQTLDGKMATNSNDSKWITNEQARRDVHELRSRYDAVLVGRQTANNDNPSLDIRMGVEAGDKLPYRIIVGSISKLDFTIKILSDENTKKTVIVTTVMDYQSCDSEKIKMIEEREIKIIFAGNQKKDFDFKEAYKKIGELGITSILIEGGAQVASDVISKNLFDKISIYIAPKIIGLGKSYLNIEYEKMGQAKTFKDISVKTIGDQVVYEMYPEV